MTQLPSGTVTFLFTDIEGSTKLAQQYPDAIPVLLARHNKIIDQAVEIHHGVVFRIIGDSYSAAFHTAEDALNAALEAQRNLQNENWSPAPIKVRMGINTGAAELEENSREISYSGYTTLATTQRVMSAGHGGQILLSQSTFDLISDELPENVTLRDMGEHFLKDINQAKKLYQVVAADLSSDFPELKTLEVIRHNLPPPLTSFIGRENELAEAKNKLNASRLVTLIGPGGTGKTRLSLQIAHDKISDFEDGVWIVELAPITDPAFIVAAIAAVFDLREIQNISLLQVVLDYLRAKDLLLILDNCEHLVEASAKVVDQILHACDKLKIIASSREALGIDGETVFRVPSLSLPKDSSDSLMDFEATRLFIERAAKAEPRFHATTENASFITQICRRLDGIPLAIELAAARVKLFTPQQIAERLDDRFKLLSGGSRTALPRQQTLRALIDWSYQSLNEIEQKTLRRLAVFSGGWTIEATESVVGETEAVQGLLGLVNKSLVNVEEQDGKSRYRFLETIRQYAMEKLLESGEATETRNRHLDYFLQMTEESGQRIFGIESMELLDHTELEYDNIRMALEWSTSNNIQKAGRLAISIGGFWTSRDYNSESRYWCREILNHSESLPNSQSMRATLYGLLAWTSVTLGDHKEGRAAGQAGLALAKEVDNQRLIARLLVIIGLSSTFLGDFPTAQKAIEEAESIARSQKYKSELGMILNTASQIIFYREKDYVKAKAYLDEATDLAKEAGFQWSTSMSAYGAGRLAGVLGDIATARARFGESAEIAHKFGNKRIVYASRSELAHILRLQGEIDEALQIYMELLPKWTELGHRAAVAHELECIAYILTRKEEPEKALTLLGAAEALRERIDTYRIKMEEEEYQQEISRLHSMLDEVEINRLWEIGRALTMDQAIQFAFEAGYG